MRVLIRLTAPRVLLIYTRNDKDWGFLLSSSKVGAFDLVSINARPVIKFQAGLANLIYRLNGN
jgi:hypothetical protein